MNSEIRTVVTFSSTAFDMAEPKDYFMNPCCFGDAVAKWLIAELRKQVAKTDEQPGQEDFGWYLNFEITGKGHTFERRWRRRQAKPPQGGLPTPYPPESLRQKSEKYGGSK